MACSIAPSPLSGIEQERLNRMAENKRRLEESGLLESAKNLMKLMKPPAAISKKPAKRNATTPRERKRKTRHQPVRRSGRLCGAPAEFAQGVGDDDCCAAAVAAGITYSDSEPGLKDLLAGDVEIESLPSEKQTQFQEMRCAAAGRGSMYDSVAGITCHFCRQKKLCGEEGCPRCSRRSTTADCIGKTDCSRCHSATGRFCRACLLIRYGQTMEEAREEMAAGTWLCPHCYEEEHPEEGWMCNSSICMKRRGFKPTGIAIYDAQQRGFPSVAHWLQAQLLKDNNNNTKAAAAGGAGAGGSNKAASSSQGSNAPSEGEAEVATVGTAAKAAAAAAAAGKGAATTSPRAAAAGGAGRSTRKGAAGASSQQSRQGSCDGEEVAAVAPGTPGKPSEGTPGPGAAAAGADGGRPARVTRAAAAAGGAGASSGKQPGAAAAAVAATATAGSADPAGKRACVEESAGTRRSLRFRH